jgi:soluble lytic murein transglycosylase-like protein
MKMPFLIIGLGLLALFFLVKNVGAFQATPGKPSLPTGTANVPYADLILMSSRTWGVPSKLINAVIRTESNFDPNAISGQNCYGLMQVSPMVAQDFGQIKNWQNPTEIELSNLLNPQTNINLGTRFLSKLLGKYSFDTAIQMYNVGEAGYNSGKRAAGYLAKVKGFYNEYQS